MSSGRNRLSRLSTEGLKRVLISWLLCTVLRFLYLLALVLITSVTYGISKSLCKVWLETYQGALLIILSIFDRNVWRILVLDGLLHPHSSIPYVQMGRSVVYLCGFNCDTCMYITYVPCNCHCCSGSLVEIWKALDDGSLLLLVSSLHNTIYGK